MKPNAIDAKAREELERLDGMARRDVGFAREYFGESSPIASNLAVASALLAIESRLRMATSVLLWALEDDEPQRKPRI